MNENRTKLGLNALMGIFSRDELGQLQNLYRKVIRDDKHSVGPLTNGRFVRETTDTIVVVYPLRDFYGPHVGGFDDGILREIATLEALKFNICECFPDNYSLSKSDDAIAIEFKNPGMTLRSVIQRKALMAKHGLDIFRLLFHAIGRLSFKGYAHRNLLPENVLISSDFKELQLMGFDRACHRERETEKL
jgi:serine/threonine protein kinase